MCLAGDVLESSIKISTTHWTHCLNYLVPICLFYSYYTMYAKRANFGGAMDGGDGGKFDMDSKLDKSDNLEGVQQPEAE